MTILTCNTRYAGAHDGENRWPLRRDLCASVIASRSPDIICFQEMWSEQFADLVAADPDYAAHAVIDEPIGRHPVNCIAYRKAAFRCLSAGGYWLSTQPHIAGSKSWDSACVRLAAWVRLEDRSTGGEFRVINTHLDHIGQTARENQARLIVEDCLAYPAAYPQILCGDMNCDIHNPAIQVFQAGGWVDTYAAVHGPADPGPTYHEFLGPAYQSDLGKIDWIFSRGSLQPLAAEVVRDCAGGRYPSDHYFVGAEFGVRAE